MRRRSPNEAAIAAMFQPVRCNRCHSGVYDLGTVQVTARYADCSVWKAPCCGSVVDDRGHTGWTNRKDYEHIDKADPDGHRDRWVSIDGRHVRWGR